jgi:hypothetical protein
VKAIFDLEAMRRALGELYGEVLRIYESNRDNPGAGSTPASRAFDAGRVDGLKWAIELFDKETTGGVA